MELILFTTNFPLGFSEQFLECEILYLSKSFQRITIIPLTDSGNPEPREIPENVTVLPPMLSVSLNHKTKLFLKSILNLKPLRFFISEFLHFRVYKNKLWFRNWLSFSSIGRAAMNSSTFRSISELVTPATLFYFYWGDKSSVLCPFLKHQFPANRFIARFHGSDLYEVRTPGYMPYRQILIDHLDLLVFISANGEKYLTERFPSIEQKSLVSRLGVEDQGINNPSPDNVLRIVSCSNLVTIKRLHHLVEALHYLDIPVIWNHFGDGPLFEEIKNQTDSLPDNIQVSFPGALKNIQLIHYYQHEKVDIFINVSSNEGIPVSIMEAISFGIPVIAPVVGGIPEILTAEHGYLISAEATPLEISNAIKSFYRLEFSEKERMRTAARIFWKKHFNAEVNYSDFCSHISKLIERDISDNSVGFPAIK